MPRNSSRSTSRSSYLSYLMLSLRTGINCLYFPTDACWWCQSMVMPSHDINLACLPSHSCIRYQFIQILQEFCPLTFPFMNFVSRVFLLAVILFARINIHPKFPIWWQNCNGRKNNRHRDKVTNRMRCDIEPYFIHKQNWNFTSKSGGSKWEIQKKD